MIFAGNFLPAGTINFAGASLAGDSVRWIMFAQIFVGGILILFMDEIVSKWGVGSGIGLFIIAGVSQALVGGFIGQNGFFPTWVAIALGNEPIGSVIGGSGLEAIFFGQGQLLALFTTVLIFAIVVYAESVRVEIPLSHARVKGARGRFPVKLIYASVLPMILVRALQANIQFLGRILNSVGVEATVASFTPAALDGVVQWVFSTYSQGQPVSGLFYYLAPVQSPNQWMWWTGAPSQEPWQILLRIGVDLTFMVIGGAIFAIFWVETTDMGPESTAKQIQNSGMQIPGFRQNLSVIEKVMERYIPQVTIIGGALVGLLAVAANMLGTIGAVSGTGLLLTVSITYKIYEEIAEEQLMEMHPMMRQMFG
jgi:preprotein translocase subunit SecY